MSIKKCPGCLGSGIWYSECCDGSRGCSCKGQPVYMGTCRVCGGSGSVEEDNYNPRANSNSIRGLSYLGGGRRG